MITSPLHKTKDFFETICQSSPDVIVIVDENGTIVFVNDRCRDLLGYEPSDLTGRNVETLIPARFREHKRFRLEYQKSPEVRPMGKRPLLQALHKSGIEIPVDIALSPVPSTAASEALVIAMMRNAIPRWLSEQKTHLQTIALDAAANGIIITNREGMIQWANPAITKMTGYEVSELVGSHTRILKSGLHGEEFYRELWDTVLNGKIWFGSIANRRKDGCIYYEEQHIAPVRNEEGQITNFIAIKQDVTSRKIAEDALYEANLQLKRRLAEIETLKQQLQEQAIRDPLTGLFNRRHLDEALTREFDRARRHSSPLSVILIDVDHFKDVNDTQGHAAGDGILRVLARLLLDSTRSSDTVCRFGGDEFLVLLPEATLESAAQRAERWRSEFMDQYPGSCSLSIGVAGLQPDDFPDSLIRRSDRALYLAKHRGRNCVVTEP